MPITLITAEDDEGRRLDRILRKALPDLPLSAIHRLLRKSAVRLDGEKARGEDRVKKGQVINIVMENPPLPSAEPDHFQAVRRPSPPDSFSIEILFEGNGLLIVNKPRGLAVHGGGRSGEENTDLQKEVMSFLSPKLPPSLSFRPGPLHRLDKMTSGIIVFSTNLEGAHFFSSMLQNRSIKKTYLAVVMGAIKKCEKWEDCLIRNYNLKKTFIAKKNNDIPADQKGKKAITKIIPLARNSLYTLILAEIETGRTHQIRAQAANHGHPLLGDKKYGGFLLTGYDSGGFLLHAWKMELTGGFPMPPLVEAPLSEYFKKTIQKLFGKDIEELLTSEVSVAVEFTRP